MLRLAPFAGLALLTACAAPMSSVEPTPPPPPGMELLLGKTADVAVQLLGKPGLDRREGPARQLQFSGGCVLDLFYYPKPGPAEVVTHAEARLPDGRDFAAGECLQLLLRSRQPAAAPAATPSVPVKPRPRRSG